MVVFYGIREAFGVTFAIGLAAYFYDFFTKAGRAR